MGYKKDTFWGLAWMGALRGSIRATTYIKIAVLARLLGPTEFGIFGVATLILALLEIITETGVNVILIQEKDNSEEYNNTAYVVSVFRGLLIAGILFLCSPLIAQFFHVSGATKIISLTALIPLIRGFINPAEIKFQKELLFSKEFIFRFLIYGIDGAVAIIVAFITKSAVSMVWGMIAGVVVEVLVSRLFINPKPKFVFHAKLFFEVLNRGKWVTLAGIFDYLFRNFDDIVVGRVMSAFNLGIYQIAYKISSLPITEVADVVAKVTFPVYSKIGDDGPRLKRAFIKSVIGVTVLLLICGVGLYIFTEPLVRILLGEKWLIAIPVVKTLAFLGVARGIINTTHPIFLATKKQNYSTVVSLVGMLGLGVTIYPFVLKWGIIGAGVSAIIGAFCALPVAILLINKIFKEK